MGILDFNTTTANSTPMLPGQTAPVAPTTSSFVLPPLPAVTPTPTVNVNLGATPTGAGATTPATPQAPTPTVEQTQANANFRSSLNSAVNSGNPSR